MPCRRHLLQHGRGRRRAAGHRLRPDARTPAHVVGRVRDHVHDDRRAAQMGHLVLGDRREDRRGLGPAQADVRAGLKRHRPGERPAVAVEHRQGPEIGRVQRHVVGQDLAERREVGAAVVDHHALGLAGGARGVVEADRLPFVGRVQGSETLVALGQEFLVGRARPGARPRRGTGGRPRRSPAAAAAPARAQP